MVPSEPTAVGAPAPLPRLPRLRRFIRAYRGPLLVLAGVLAVLAGALLERHWSEPPAFFTQLDIDRAVRLSLEKKPLPSKAAKAFAEIEPSVVRVLGFHAADESGTKSKVEKDVAKNAEKGAKKGAKKNAIPKAKPDLKAPPDQDEAESDNTSIGTGVVITEQGTILTNLHVVHGAKRLEVVFFDGSKSEAVLTGIDADNDLAVLQAQTLPDDLKPATLVTTGDLKPGDEVVAVGFPFGFGPSVTSGVVSGLKREFQSTDGKHVLSNLIQFDAAANPGNSGGPLINMEGEVLGIVTAIFNPVQQRFFVGLGFAVPIENAAAAVGVSPF